MRGSTFSTSAYRAPAASVRLTHSVQAAAWQHEDGCTQSRSVAQHSTEQPRQNAPGAPAATRLSSVPLRLCADARGTTGQTARRLSVHHQRQPLCRTRSDGRSTAAFRLHQRKDRRASAAAERAGKTGKLAAPSLAHAQGRALSLPLACCPDAPATKCVAVLSAQRAPVDDHPTAKQPGRGGRSPRRLGALTAMTWRFVSHN